MNEFILFARAHGLEIDPSKLQISDRVQRCGTVDKPRSSNGAYFWDGQRGWVFNWAEDASVHWFNSTNDRPWNQAEKAAWKAKRAASASNQEAKYQWAARYAAEMIRDTRLGKHDYLHRKGFPDAQGMVASDGTLVIPMRNLDTNVLQGVQLVRWVEADRHWVKKMMPGMRAKGAVFRIGDKSSPETFLVEGYATGLSVVTALRSVGLRASVLITFSANNLALVGPGVTGRAFVFADNDASGAGQRAAELTKLPWCMSPIVGEDANDLQMRAGLMAVCQQIMEVRRGRAA
jgi:putative DNA primase/helicase